MSDDVNDRDTAWENRDYTKGEMKYPACFQTIYI